MLNAKRVELSSKLTTWFTWKLNHVDSLLALKINENAQGMCAWGFFNDDDGKKMFVEKWIE